MISTDPRRSEWHILLKHRLCLRCPDPKNNSGNNGLGHWWSMPTIPRDHLRLWIVWLSALDITRFTLLARCPLKMPLTEFVVKAAN